MRFFLIASLLLTTTCFSAAAQSRLTGKVLDAATGQPVPYASVSVLNTTAGTTSNAEGEFELKAVLPSRLVVSELGHRRDTVAVAVAAQPLLIRLQPASVLLPEVKVGSYLADLIVQAYRQLRRSNDQKTYGQAFYRQITRLGDEATEVQEIMWDTKTSSAGVDGTALAQARYAKKKALVSFTNFPSFTKSYGIYSPKFDTTTTTRLISPNVAHNFTLKLLGVTQSGTHQLVEIGFMGKPGTNSHHAEEGTVTIDETTNQVLRLHLETTAVNSKSNNPLFRFKDATTIFECVYQPTATGTTCLDYVKIDYRVLLTRPFKGDLHTQVSSFTYFYDGQPTPTGVAYLSAATSQSDLASIKQTTYDPVFWQNNPVVKRTPLEDQVMKSFEQKGAFGTMLAP